MHYTDICKCEYKIKNTLHESYRNQPTDLLKPWQSPYTLLELVISNDS